MIKFHKCNFCKKRFRANEPGRIQITKRLIKGKVEFWLCSSCAKIFKEKVRDIIPIIDIGEETQIEENKEKEKISYESS
jgi:hypothetical protein